MIGAVYAVCSAVLMRGLPITLGVLVSRRFGAEEYANFVLSLSWLSLFGAIFQLGVVPPLIRTPSTSAQAGLTALSGLTGVIGLGSLLLVLLALHLTAGVESGISMLAGAVVFSSCVAAVAVALASRERRLASALKGSAVLFLTANAWVFFSFDLGSDRESNYRLAAAGIVTLGILWWLYASRQYALRHLSSTFDWRSLRSIATDSSWSALFGALTMFGLFLVNWEISDIPNEQVRAQAAVALQCFSIVIFVPGALSSYVVPRLVQDLVQVNRRVLILATSIYMALGASVALAIVIAWPLVAKVYGLTGALAPEPLFLLVLLAAVVAAANASQNQFLVALQRFKRQAGYASLWLVTLVGCMIPLHELNVGAGIALLLAYVVLLVVSLLTSHRW